MGCIDHSLLRPELTRAEVEAGVDLAIEWETATVCCGLPTCRWSSRGLRRTLVGPTTVIGFPHGAHMPNIKEREALVAVDQGAVELDVVLNIGALRSGDLGYVRDELAGLVYAVAPTPVKVILETAYLTPSRSRPAAAWPSRLAPRSSRTGRAIRHGAPRRARSRSCAGSSAIASGSRPRAGFGPWTRCCSCSPPERAVSGPLPPRRSEPNGGLAAPKRSGRPRVRPRPEAGRRALRERRGVGAGAGPSATRQVRRPTVLLTRGTFECEDGTK